MDWDLGNMNANPYPWHWWNSSAVKYMSSEEYDITFFNSERITNSKQLQHWQIIKNKYSRLLSWRLKLLILIWSFLYLWCHLSIALGTFIGIFLLLGICYFSKLDYNKFQTCLFNTSLVLPFHYILPHSYVISKSQSAFWNIL